MPPCLGLTHVHVMAIFQKIFYLGFEKLGHQNIKAHKPHSGQTPEGRVPVQAPGHSSKSHTQACPESRTETKVPPAFAPHPTPRLLCSRGPLLCSVLPGGTEDGLSVRGLVRCCLLPGSHSVGSYQVLPEARWGVRAKKGHITWCPWVLTPRATWQVMSDPSGDGQPTGASPH